MKTPLTCSRFQHIGPMVLSFIFLWTLLNLSALASYKVVMKDGRTFEARNRPVSMEGQYRFTSMDGKFCVFPLSQVDLKATETTNQSHPTAPPPAKRYTNEDLTALGNSALTQEKSSANSTQQGGAAKEASPIDKAQFPEKVRDESYWRKRAKLLKDQIAAVDKQIENLNQKISEKKSEGIIYGMGTYTPYLVAGLNNLQDQLFALQKEKDKLQKEYGDLEEEARKAGAMPGWLR